MVPFVLGVAAGFVAAFLLVGVIAVAFLGLWAFGGAGEETPEEIPRATLRVAEDGCGVIRSDFGGDPPEGLQWVVTDAQGFQVLGRNALGETRYRHYQAGEYRVVLEAFDGEKYAPASNRVEIRCP